MKAWYADIVQGKKKGFITWGKSNNSAVIYDFSVGSLTVKKT